MSLQINRLGEFLMRIARQERESIRARQQQEQRGRTATARFMSRLRSRLRSREATADAAARRVVADRSAAHARERQKGETAFRRETGRREVAFKRVQAGAAQSRARVHGERKTSEHRVDMQRRQQQRRHDADRRRGRSADLALPPRARARGQNREVARGRDAGRERVDDGPAANVRPGDRPGDGRQVAPAESDERRQRGTALPGEHRRSREGVGDMPPPEGSRAAQPHAVEAGDRQRGNETVLPSQRTAAAGGVERGGGGADPSHAAGDNGHYKSSDAQPRAPEQREQDRGRQVRHEVGQETRQQERTGAAVERRAEGEATAAKRHAERDGPAMGAGATAPEVTPQSSGGEPGPVREEVDTETRRETAQREQQNENHNPGRGRDGPDFEP